MFKQWVKASCIVCIIISGGVSASVVIKSPNGNRVIFSQEKQGDHIDPHVWGKIYFIHGAQQLDLSRDNRYYTEDGSSKLSPSGKYLKITSIAGDYVTTGDGSKKYTDRAYCSVIDMKNGCVVSDWGGELAVMIGKRAKIYFRRPLADMAINLIFFH